jgi:hypothetical protein
LPCSTIFSASNLAGARQALLGLPPQLFQLTAKVLPQSPNIFSAKGTLFPTETSATIEEGEQTCTHCSNPTKG